MDIYLMCLPTFKSWVSFFHLKMEIIMAGIYFVLIKCQVLTLHKSLDNTTR